MARHELWCSSRVFLIFGISSMIWIHSATADCHYDDQVYEEGVEVETFEHCLNCTCTKGVLLCYLRVCPALPNPPPIGCILLHRYRTCCPELICTDFTGNGNSLESRSDPDGIEISSSSEDEESDACIFNGSVYAPGSAMASSSRCDYCYCLRGKQTCVKPKCLLPIDGCTPTYESDQCCPVQYNCSLSSTVRTTTTTVNPKMTQNQGGCIVENEFYAEGSKVLGIGHSVCDNCYCLRGMMRCEPLSCAPSLLGCVPIIKNGECCAASYNCTGSIEINPQPYYGQNPIVSSEYSKLRKEQPKKPYTTYNNRRSSPNTKPSDDPYYVIAETPDSKIQQDRAQQTTSRPFSSFSFNPSTTTPFYYQSMIKESGALGFKHVTRSYVESKFGRSTLNNDDNGKNQQSRITMDSKGKSTTSIFISSTVTEDSDETIKTTMKLFDSEEATTVDDTTDSSSTSESMSTMITSTKNEDILTTTYEDFTTEVTTKIGSESETITIRSVLNSTDCINSTEYSPVEAVKINELEETNRYTPSVELSSSESTKDVTEIDLQSSFGLIDNIYPKVKNGSKITSLMNVSKDKEDDYDSDYSDPSLPPSLPNLHIIPFLAADALDSTKNNDNSLYAQDKSSNDSFEFPNLFSPPIETEGGFVPNSNPIILETLHDNTLTMAPPPFPTENPPASCSSHGEEIIHGQSVLSESPCTTCSCFFGNIVCQKSPCPLPPPNCRKTLEDSTLCCPLYSCDLTPNVTGSSLESALKPPDTSLLYSISTDPFKNVIKTEPAPDLHSLMVDMLPHLTEKTIKRKIHITTQKTIESEPYFQRTTDRNEEDLSLDKVLELLIGGLQNQNTTSSSAENATTDYDAKTLNNISNNLESMPQNGSSAVLKLAGCNIYGRMYRVGRIISELSGPCLECKCTEIGVQCEHLKC